MLLLLGRMNKSSHEQNLGHQSTTYLQNNTADAVFCAAVAAYVDKTLSDPLSSTVLTALVIWIIIVGKYVCISFHERQHRNV